MIFCRASQLCVYTTKHSTLSPAPSLPPAVPSPPNSSRTIIMTPSLTTYVNASGYECEILDTFQKVRLDNRMGPSHLGPSPSPSGVRRPFFLNKIACICNYTRLREAHGDGNASARETGRARAGL